MVMAVMKDYDYAGVSAVFVCLSAMPVLSLVLDGASAEPGAELSDFTALLEDELSATAPDPGGTPATDVSLAGADVSTPAKRAEVASLSCVQRERPIERSAGQRIRPPSCCCGCSRRGPCGLVSRLVHAPPATCEALADAERQMRGAARMHHRFVDCAKRKSAGEREFTAGAMPSEPTSDDVPGTARLLSGSLVGDVPGTAHVAGGSLPMCRARHTLIVVRTRCAALGTR